MYNLIKPEIKAFMLRILRDVFVWCLALFPLINGIFDELLLFSHRWPAASSLWLCMQGWFVRAPPSTQEFLRRSPLTYWSLFSVFSIICSHNLPSVCRSHSNFPLRTNGLVFILILTRSLICSHRAQNVDGHRRCAGITWSSAAACKTISAADLKNLLRWFLLLPNCCTAPVMHSFRVCVCVCV